METLSHDPFKALVAEIENRGLEFDISQLFKAGALATIELREAKKEFTPKEQQEATLSKYLELIERVD
ncbi:hypothetical protein ACFL3T_00125 [Patescibacteria group bacterium]